MNEPSTTPSTTPSLVELAHALDNEGMIGYTRAFVHDFRQGLNHVSLERFDWINELANTKWTGILCLGMGGSAAGGEFLSALASFQGTIPVQVQRDYTLPSWWNPTWLIVATSHSGNTEETLEATETALKAGATVVAISTGGILAGLPELYTNCHLVPSLEASHPGVLLDTSSAVNWACCVSSVCYQFLRTAPTRQCWNDCNKPWMDLTC